MRFQLLSLAIFVSSSLAGNCVYEKINCDYICMLSNLKQIDKVIDFGVGHLDGFSILNVTSVTSDILSGVLENLDKSIMKKLEIITRLELTNLGMKSIQDDAFESCNMLETVNLKCNYLEEIGDNLFNKCYSVKSIDLSQNKIKTLKFSNLLMLESLNLEKNHLLSVNFQGLQNLKILNLAKNWINSTSFVKCLPNLQSLNLYLNEIQRLDKNSFFEVKKLEILVLSANTMTEIHPLAFRGLSNLILLDLNSNQLHVLKENTFVHTPNLKNLYLNHNSIEITTENVLVPLLQLRTLDLASNMIKSLNLDYLISLINLDLSNNLIYDLPDKTFAQLDNIQILNLSSNALSILKLSSFGKNEQLTELIVRFNSVQAIERGFSSHFINLLKLDAFGNECIKNDDDLSTCYENWDKLISTTTSYPPKSEFTNKNFVMTIIGIIAIAALLLALIFYIHDSILGGERRKVIKKQKLKEVDKSSRNYERF